MSGPLDPRLLVHLLRWQFQINTLASVSIEYPKLRPALYALIADDPLKGASVGDGG